MPSIPPRVLDSVCYLYPDRQAAEDGIDFGGAGFIVGVPSLTSPFNHFYAVSNYHVAVRPKYGAPNPVIRLNTLDGGRGIFEKDPIEWHFKVGGGDLAITELPFRDGVHQASYISTEDFLRYPESFSKHISVGDDVFMVGRFFDHDGNDRNAPAARFGNISIDPRPFRDIQVSNSAPELSYYCLDMHSRSGFSGSPVFVYRTPYDDLRKLVSGDLNPSAFVLRFLGIHCGQFPDSTEVLDGGEKSDRLEVRGLSGMTYALPAWEIAALLDDPKFAESRRSVDAELGKRRYPVEEASGKKK